MNNHEDHCEDHPSFTSFPFLARTENHRSLCSSFSRPPRTTALFPSGRYTVAGYTRSEGRTPVTFGHTDLVYCRTLQGHTGICGLSLDVYIIVLNLLLGARNKNHLCILRYMC